MIRQPLQVYVHRGTSHDRRLAGAGAPADQHEPPSAGAVQDVEAVAAQRFEPASDARLVGPGLGKPSLRDLGSEPPARAVDRRVGVRLDEGSPRLDTCTLHLAADQPMAEFNGGRAPAAFVYRADGGTFLVVDERQVDGTGERTTGVFARRADIDQDPGLPENFRTIFRDA